MTSKYRESDKRADGSYAFEWLSRYFDVIHWPFYAAPLKVECAVILMWTGPLNHGISHIKRTKEPDKDQLFANPCKRHRKENIYSATSWHRSNNWPLLPDPFGNRTSMIVPDWLIINANQLNKSGATPSGVPLFSYLCKDWNFPDPKGLTFAWPQSPSFPSSGSSSVRFFVGRQRDSNLHRWFLKGGNRGY